MISHVGRCDFDAENMRMGIWALTLAVPLGFGLTWYRSAEWSAPGGGQGVSVLK